MRILVTGSSGHLAQTVIPKLQELGHIVLTFDLPLHDILDRKQVRYAAQDADMCIHLAGMKYADRGELFPLEAVETNVQGTANIIDAFGPRAIVASTCKAADPETVYGCTKLITERIALEAGAKVVRFVNVLGSAGSVTDIWNDVPNDEPLPVCDATRLFITDEQAADLVVNALDWPTGRYAPHIASRRHMADVARELHPGRAIEIVPLRRGDRQRERLLANCERATRWHANTVRIVGQHDPQTITNPLELAAAA